MPTNYAIKIWSVLIGDKMKDSFKIALILLLASVNTLDAQALPAATTGSTTHQTKLKRLDFRLEKVSCARCILNVRQALRKADGVTKCEIALRKPYGAVVIFDPAKLNQAKIVKLVETADPGTHPQALDFIEENLSQMPPVLMPKHNAFSHPTK